MFHDSDLSQCADQSDKTKRFFWGDEWAKSLSILHFNSHKRLTKRLVVIHSRVESETLSVYHRSKPSLRDATRIWWVRLVRPNIQANYLSEMCNSAKPVTDRTIWKWSTTMMKMGSFQQRNMFSWKAYGNRTHAGSMAVQMWVNWGLVQESS